MSVLYPYTPPSHIDPQTPRRSCQGDHRGLGKPIPRENHPRQVLSQPLPLLTPHRSDPLNQKRKYGCRKADGTRPLGDPSGVSKEAKAQTQTHIQTQKPLNRHNLNVSSKLQKLIHLSSSTHTFPTTPPNPPTLLPTIHSSSSFRGARR